MLDCRDDTRAVAPGCRIAGRAEETLPCTTDRGSGSRSRLCGTRPMVGLLRGYGVTAFIFDTVAVLVGVVGVVAVWGLSMRLVGQVAEAFGEDAARWRLLMLPFGVFGPVVARVSLSRNGGGRGGFSSRPRGKVRIVPPSLAERAAQLGLRTRHAYRLGPCSSCLAWA
jgi:hypothetical protein